MSMHFGCVCDPPEVYPIRVDLCLLVTSVRESLVDYLVVRDKHQTLGKVALEPAVGSLSQLSSHAFVSTDSHLDGCPPVRHGGAQHAKMLLGHGHPGIEPVPAVKVQGRADDLGDGDADAGC
jgi:hypothetical protein